MHLGLRPHEPERTRSPRRGVRRHDELSLARHRSARIAVRRKCQPASGARVSLGPCALSASPTTSSALEHLEAVLVEHSRQRSKPRVIGQAARNSRCRLPIKLSSAAASSIVARKSRTGCRSVLAALDQKFAAVVIARLQRAARRLERRLCNRGGRAFSARAWRRPHPPPRAGQLE